MLSSMRAYLQTYSDKLDEALQFVFALHIAIATRWFLLGLSLALDSLSEVKA